MGDRGGTDSETGKGAGRTLVWAVRTAAITAFAGLAATQYLARASAPPGAGAVTHVAQGGPARPVRDPDTTGSIVGGARFVKLDPCAAIPALRSAKH